MNEKTEIDLVSVIIPTYNSAVYLKDAIDSVLTQSYQQIELVIVDDGSTDNTKEVVSVYLTDKRVSYHYQDNQGVSNARNHGASLSKGVYLCFLDADDVFLPTNIEKKLNRIKQNTLLGLVHADVQMMDSEKRLLSEWNRGMSGKDRHLDLLLWNECVIPAPSSILIRRDVFNEVGKWDPAFSTAADQDLFIRVTKKYEIERIPEVHTYYRVVLNSMGKNIAVFERDHIGVYIKMKNDQVFPDRKFENLAFAKLHLIIATSWWVHHHRVWKTVKHLIASITYSFTPLLQKLKGK